MRVFGRSYEQAAVRFMLRAKPTYVTARVALTPNPGFLRAWMIDVDSLAHGWLHAR